MDILRKLGLTMTFAAAVVCSGGLLGGCEEESDFEDAIEDAGENVGDAAEDVGQGVEDAVE